MSEKRLKTGLIGLGRAGVQMHLTELQKFRELYQITAVCDILPERVAEVCKDIPEAVPYTDPDMFFAHSDMDLVAIATPSQVHAAMTKRALEAGKIVFLEKPFALSHAGLEELERLDRRFPGKLFLRHNRRFEACFNHIMEVIASGRIGEVTEVKLRRLRHRFRDDWQTRLDCGGGQLNNWGPHLIDQALQFLEGDAVSVWSDLKRIAARGDAEDHIKLVFRGGDGRIVDVEISDAVAHGEPVATVYGTRGMLLSENEQTLKILSLPEDYIVPDSGARLAPPPIYGPDVYSTIPDPVWQTEEIPVAPANGFRMDDIYLYLHRAICRNIPFPVKNHEGFSVVRTTLKIREQHPEFHAAGDLL